MAISNCSWIGKSSRRATAEFICVARLRCKSGNPIAAASIRNISAQADFNNQKNQNYASKFADHYVGEWNRFRIVMMGQKVHVFLNNELVVENVTMENYWDRTQPIFSTRRNRTSGASRSGLFQERLCPRNSARASQEKIKSNV